MFGLTIRQCVCAAAALAICVLLYIFGKDFLGDDLVGWIVILTALPILAFGFFRYDGMPFEQFIAMLYRQKWVEPQKRKYEELPVFWSCRDGIIEDEVAHQLAEQSHKEKKERRKKK